MDTREQPCLAWREAVTDDELSTLHAAAFGHEYELEAWNERLERHSLGWVTARRGEALIGFCNIITDGGRHAFLLDTAVHPERQGTGIGRELVTRAIEECRAAPVEWLHVDFEEDLGPFYMTEGLFRRTTAGILRV
ncbi:GNAT family N-acetyltransferase [Brachybacterium sp. AOP43-C2-M15]|uniref:GNAT family N-acetyltransferase n=1 Tax=Brachybacterium sp. AOP43-C2-M15 TaxID=3457661 RepID=UPI004033D754